MSLEERIARARVRAVLTRLGTFLNTDRPLTHDDYIRIKQDFIFLKNEKSVFSKEQLDKLGEQFQPIIVNLERETVTAFIKSRMHLQLKALSNEDLVILHVLCKKIEAGDFGEDLDPFCVKKKETNHPECIVQANQRCEATTEMMEERKLFDKMREPGSFLGKLYEEVDIGSVLLDVPQMHVDYPRKPREV